jgi:hypothetical protein
VTQLPPSLHTAVKSGRSNRFIEVTPMNSASEPWSHPWQALQRTLAKGFGADAAIYPPNCAGSPGARLTADAAASWLVRARSAIVQQRRVPGSHP